jgi:phosphopantetheine--protein transferase-like protein
MSGSECLNTTTDKNTCKDNIITLPVTKIPTPAMQAIGVDIADIKRLRALCERWQESVISRLFTDQEQNYCQSRSGYRWASLAGRFSAKEAVKKILASHGESAGWTEIEILNGPYGEPYIRLYGRAQDALERLGYKNLMLSISHDANLAIATVIAS